jgi:hypothetical protein
MHSGKDHILRVSEKLYYLSPLLRKLSHPTCFRGELLLAALSLRQFFFLCCYFLFYSYYRYQFAIYFCLLLRHSSHECPLGVILHYDTLLIRPDFSNVRTDPPRVLPVPVQYVPPPEPTALACWP